MLKLKSYENSITILQREIDRLKEEKKMLEIIINEKIDDKDLVNIFNVFVVNLNGKKYFVKKSCPNDRWNKFTDIFNDDIIASYYEDILFSCSPFDGDPKHIRKVFNELCAYKDDMVPRKKLELLYYRINGVTPMQLKNIYSEAQ